VHAAAVIACLSIGRETTPLTAQRLKVHRPCQRPCLPRRAPACLGSYGGCHLRQSAARSLSGHSRLAQGQHAGRAGAAGRPTCRWTPPGRSRAWSRSWATRAPARCCGRLRRPGVRARAHRPGHCLCAGMAQVVALGGRLRLSRGQHIPLTQAAAACAPPADNRRMGLYMTLLPTNSAAAAAVALALSARAAWLRLKQCAALGRRRTAAMRHGLPPAARGLPRARPRPWPVRRRRGSGSGGRRRGRDGHAVADALLLRALHVWQHGRAQGRVRHRARCARSSRAPSLLPRM